MSLSIALGLTSGENPFSWLNLSLKIEGQKEICSHSLTQQHFYLLQNIPSIFF